MKNRNKTSFKMLLPRTFGYGERNWKNNIGWEPHDTFRSSWKDIQLTFPIGNQGIDTFKAAG